MVLSLGFGGRKQDQETHPVIWGQMSAILPETVCLVSCHWNLYLSISHTAPTHHVACLCTYPEGLTPPTHTADPSVCCVDRTHCRTMSGSLCEYPSVALPPCPSRPFFRVWELV